LSPGPEEIPNGARYCEKKERERDGYSLVEEKKKGGDGRAGIREKKINEGEGGKEEKTENLNILGESA